VSGRREHFGDFMLARIARLFIIRTRLDAFAVIYVLALGAVERGSSYLVRFPGLGGKLLFLACIGVVFVAGAKLLDAVRDEHERKDPAPGSEPT
jgi:hypothetical protein